MMKEAFELVEKDLLKEWVEAVAWGNLASTVLLVLLVALTRFLLSRGLKKSSAPFETQREWHSYVKSLSHILIFVGFVMIWASELRTLALSLLAIAAAIVIATKELILCLMGGVLKSLSRPYKVGDRIEVGTYRGDVLEHDFLITTLFEVGPGKSTHYYTGKKIIVPNSILLSSGVYNETKRFKFGLHAFTVSVPFACDIGAYKKALLASAFEVTDVYKGQAAEQLYNWNAIRGVSPPDPDPKISVSFSSGTQIDLIVRVAIPALKAAKIEEAILEKFIEKTSSLRKSSNEGDSAS